MQRAGTAPAHVTIDAHTLSARRQADEVDAQKANHETTATDLITRNNDHTMAAASSVALNEDAEYLSLVHETAFNLASPRPKPSTKHGRRDVSGAMRGDLRGEAKPTIFGDRWFVKQWGWLALLALGFPLVVLAALLQGLLPEIVATGAGARRQRMPRTSESGREGDKSIASKLKRE
eukprot:1739472-Prymnesium_polylepis.1